MMLDGSRLVLSFFYPILASCWHFCQDDLCFNAFSFENDRRGPQLYCFCPFFYRIYSALDTLSLALEKCVLSFIVWEPVGWLTRR
jgi:hypothetical protein